MSTGLDFEGLAQHLLHRAREFLPSWLPGGKMLGVEYACSDLRGGTGQSLRVNTKTGVWADFSTDDKGGDLISLYAAIHNLSQGEAAKELSGQIGFSLKPEQHRRPLDSEDRIIIPPKDAPVPNMRHNTFGDPTKTWCYLNADKTVLFYVARYDPPTGDKQFLPWSWSKKFQRFVLKGFPAPRPLYGLELLSEHRDRPVLITEGEKACDAARSIVGSVYTVVSWPNGAKAFKQVDWKPVYGRKVLIWPDADKPGKEASRGIAELLHSHCPEVKIIDIAESEWSHQGWDAADALAQGWAYKDLTDWAKPRVILYAPVKVREPAAVEAQPEPERLLDPALAYDKNKTHAEHSVVFANHLKNQILFDEFHETWYRFNQTWEPITQGDVDRAVIALLDQNYSWRYSVSWLNGIVRFLKARLGRSPLMNEANLHVMDTWNTRQELFPMRNGVLNLETRELIPHSPELMMNWMVPYEYDSQAECPTIRQFLKNLSQGDESAEVLALCYLWAVLHGCADLQKYLELIGKPGTGKSTYIQIATLLVGARNTVITTMKQLSENRFETANLYGKRLAVITDADKWAGSMDTFKAITGQDPIRYEEKMKQQGKPFVFSGMIIVAGNGPIQSNEQSTALVRRRLSIHLDKFFPNEKRDDRLLAKIQNEMPGLLNWLISLDRKYVLGVLRDLQQARLEASRRAQVETDAVAAWIDEKLVSAPGYSTKIGVLERDHGEILNRDQLYPNFIHYLESSGRYSKVTLQDFSSRVVEILESCGHDVEKRHSKAGRHITNVKLRGEYDSLMPRPITLTYFEESDPE